MSDREIPLPTDEDLNVHSDLPQYGEVTLTDVERHVDHCGDGNMLEADTKDSWEDLFGHLKACLRLRERIVERDMIRDLRQGTSDPKDRDTLKLRMTALDAEIRRLARKATDDAPGIAGKLVGLYADGVKDRWAEIEEATNGRR